MRYSCKPSALLHRLADVMDDPRTWHADGLQDDLTQEERSEAVLSVIEHVLDVARSVYGRDLLADVGEGAVE